MVGSDVAEITEVAEYLLASGGKRLRPALTALGCLAVDLDPIDPRLLCCGELVHLGSLLHDDVVDQGDVRRGRPAAHVVHGNAVSVLGGDFCVAKALLAAGEAGGGATMVALARTVAEMSEGEVWQLRRAGALDGDRDAYFDIIDRKSASLIAWCASAGALSCGDHAAAAALSAYGRGVGRAFQIADDVLDFRADTGKLRGADLRERKMTLPLLYAMERWPGLRDRLMAGPPEPSELPELVRLVLETGAPEAALVDARHEVDGAVRALEVLPAGAARDALAVIARYVVERRS
jgi:octaprenyl-diphosphate synthase